MKPLLLLLICGVLALASCQRDTQPYGGKGNAANEPAYDTKVSVNNPVVRK